MKKSDYQWEFLKCIGLLIAYAAMRGYKLTQGRGYASKAANAADGGHENSTHLHRLGQDFNLFVEDNGVERLVTGDSEEWRDLGLFWCSLHPKARWGGDFEDFGHFSFTWRGIK